MEKELIENKLLYLDELLRKINKKYKLYKKENNEENLDTLYLAISKLFEEICEISISVNNLLLEEKDDFAQTYALSFLKLKKHYKINKEFIEKISQSSRFRNKVVHNYSQLKEELVIEKIEEFIKLFEKYKKEILKLI